MTVSLPSDTPDTRETPLRILSLTSNDLGISYGPAVHYLELWNEISAIAGNVSIDGMAPSWTGLPPIVPPAFSLKQYRVAIPAVRQVLWDLICGWTILFTKANVAYVRVSRFHLATILALNIRSRLFVAVEINGSAVHDANSRGHNGPTKHIAALSERWLIKRAQVVFSVTEKLRGYAARENPYAENIYVENGVSRRFFRLRKVAESESVPRPLTGIYVGTFTAWDGALQIKELATRFPEISFLMIGDGSQRAAIESNAPPNMKFLGWIDYKLLPKYYSRSDFGIVLYERNRHEAIGSSPLKLREYMASELPIFTSTANGTEVVSELGIGLRSGKRDAADFSLFIRSLGLYRANYSKVKERLLAEVSWAGAAKITLNGLKDAALR